jgi:hypothetical protein
MTPNITNTDQDTAVQLRGQKFTPSIELPLGRRGIISGATIDEQVIIYNSIHSAVKVCKKDVPGCQACPKMPPYPSKEKPSP